MRKPIAYGAFVLLQLASGTAASRAEGPAAVKPIVVESKSGGRTSYWLESSLERIFPATASGSVRLNLLAARNGRTSLASR